MTFYTNKDLQKLEKFMQGKPVAEQEIGKQLLLETAAYAESSVCRRRHCCTISVKNIRKKIVEIVTTV